MNDPPFEILTKVVGPHPIPDDANPLLRAVLDYCRATDVRRLHTTVHAVEEG